MAKVIFRFTLTDGAKQFIERLRENRLWVIVALREAITRTLMQAISSRYVVNKSRMRTYESMEPWPDVNDDRVLEVLDALEQAEEARAGMFEEVMHFLTDSSEIDFITEDPNTIVAAFGHIPTLDTIKSPSATEFLTGHASRSPYNILWRQMEFGMGALRKPGDLPVLPTPYTSSRGGWWYGKKKPGSGVPFRGTNPGNLLRDAANLPYSTDAAAFYQMFGARLASLLG